MKINHYWDDADENPTQYYNDEGFYVDYIEALNRWEVSLNSTIVYYNEDLNKCFEYIDSIEKGINDGENL